MKQETVNRILEVGSDLFLKKGYNAVGLNEILKSAGIPKGSFYYYFKNKEDFGIQVIEHFAKHSLNNFDEYMMDESMNSKEKIVSYFKYIDRFYTQKEFKEGCLLGNSSIELADKSDPFSVAIAHKLNAYQDRFEKLVLQGQKEGSIKTDKLASEVSDFIVTNWHGSLLRMKSSKNTDSIKIFIKFLEVYIL